MNGCEKMVADIPAGIGGGEGDGEGDWCWAACILDGIHGFEAAIRCDGAKDLDG